MLGAFFRGHSVGYLYLPALSIVSTQPELRPVNVRVSLLTLENRITHLQQRTCRPTANSLQSATSLAK